MAMRPMATSYRVQDCYNVVTDVLLEPFSDGASPGLSLGIVTLADFLSLFSVVLEDFVARSGLVYAIFTQQLVSGTSQYLIPETMDEPKVAFVGGQYIDHSTLADLDDWNYNWQNQTGVPEFWHSDGLPPKTVETALNPSYTGAGYVTPTDPLALPPFGITGLFNGATIGQFTGTATVVGTTVTWVTGPLFDTNWNNYYPPLNMSLNGTPIAIQTVTDNQHITLTVAPGNGSYTWLVMVSNDGNLTLVGTSGLAGITYALGDTVPVIPDSFCPALSYGILARLFSEEGELKDTQRAYYCQARFTEYANAAAGISGEMLEVDR